MPLGLKYCMESIDPRLAPPFWRHDAYTLDSLQRVIRQAIVAARRDLSQGAAPAMVVDIGAGTAPYRALFEDLGAKYLTCDVNDGDPSAAPAQPDVTLVPGEKIALRSQSADWVVSFQVLEHVWDLDWYLGECRRILKANGVLLLSTHGTWPYHPHPTDFRRWTRDGLTSEIRSRGFNIESVFPIVGPLAWTTQFRTLAYHHVLSQAPIIGSALSALVCSFMHLRMRVEDAITPKTQLETNAAVYLVLATVSRPSGPGGID